MSRFELITKSHLVGDLRRLGIEPGQIVMVHSSIKSIGWILGGPDVVVESLLSVVELTGTVMAYTDWQDGVQDITRTDSAYQSNPKLQELLDELPAFDASVSRACPDYGMLPEYMRTQNGAHRSGNPDASVCAIGHQAEWICSNHPLQYGYGPGSPLGKLVEASGKVLLLGSPLAKVTLLHYSEHMANVPNKRVINYREPILIDGKKQWVDIEEFDTDNPVVLAADDYFFGDIVQEFLDAGHGQTGRVGNAISHLLDAAMLHAFAVEWIEEKFG